MTIEQRLRGQKASADEKVRKAAMDVLSIAKALKKLNDGHVWERQWNVLVKLHYKRNEEVWYEPTAIGSVFLKGLANN